MDTFGNSQFHIFLFKTLILEDLKNVYFVVSRVISSITTFFSIISAYEKGEEIRLPKYDHFHVARPTSLVYRYVTV